MRVTPLVDKDSAGRREPVIQGPRGASAVPPSIGIFRFYLAWRHRGPSGGSRVFPLTGEGVYVAACERRRAAGDQRRGLVPKWERKVSLLNGSPRDIEHTGTKDEIQSYQMAMIDKLK